MLWSFTKGKMSLFYQSWEFICLTLENWCDLSDYWYFSRINSIKEPKRRTFFLIFQWKDSQRTSLVVRTMNLAFDFYTFCPCFCDLKISTQKFTWNSHKNFTWNSSRYQFLQMSTNIKILLRKLTLLSRMSQFARAQFTQKLYSVHLEW